MAKKPMPKERVRVGKTTRSKKRATASKKPKMEKRFIKKGTHAQ